MNELWAIIFGGAMFGAGGFAMRTVYRPIVDAAYEIAGLQVENASMKFDRDVEEMRKASDKAKLAFEEMMVLRQKEIEISDADKLEKHNELIAVHAEYSQKIAALENKLLKSQSRHKKASILVNDYRKTSEGLATDNLKLITSHNALSNEKAVLEAELQVKDIQVADLQETAKKDLEKINQKAIKFERDIRQETKDIIIKEELRNSSLMAENMQLRKKIKRINKRRKVAARISNERFDAEHAIRLGLKQDVEDAARVIRKLRNTR